MARNTPDIIVIDDNFAIKKDKREYVVCSKYVNPKKPDEVTWVNETYHGSLGGAIKALPNHMLGAEKINSLEEAYQACNRIADHLAQLFDNMVKIEPKPIQVVIREDCEDL